MFAMCRAERGGVEARRLDVDDHEVPCGVHFFSIAACTDKKAESVGAQRFTVPTTNIGTTTGGTPDCSWHFIPN